MAQSSYYTYNDQPILLSHRYPPPKLDAALPPLSHLLTTDNNSNTILLKNEPLVSGEGYYSTQSPSAMLANTDTPLTSADTSVDLFDSITPSVTTTDTTDYVLTSVPLSTVSATTTTATAHPLQHTTSLYMPDPTTAVATMMYGPTLLPPTNTAAANALVNSTTVTSSVSPSPSSTLPLSSTSSPMDPLLLSTTAPVTINSGLDTTVPYFHPSAPYNTTTTTATPTTRSRQDSISSNSSSSDKVYSFVAIPGMDQKKRPRRRYDEIERLYHCTYSGCKKSYGTLNHLNSHVLMQSHGPKRHPSEFKEMRKEWRRQRKQREQQRKQSEKANKEHQPQQPTLTTAFQPPPSFMPTSFPLQPMPLPGFY